MLSRIDGGDDGNDNRDNYDYYIFNDYSNDYNNNDNKGSCRDNGNTDGYDTDKMYEYKIKIKYNK